MAGWSLVADHAEGCQTTLARMRLMLELGSTPGTSTNAAPAGATLRTVPEMGARFRRPIHSSAQGTNISSWLWTTSQSGWRPNLQGQYGGLNGQIPVRTHLVPFWVSLPANQ